MNINPTLLKLMPEHEQWILIGLYYGYPQCCIEAFCKKDFGVLTTSQKRVVDGNGFIPCDKCCKTLIEPIKLQTLIIDRICKNPYPLENNRQNDKKMALAKKVYGIKTPLSTNKQIQQYLKDIGFNKTNAGNGCVEYFKNTLEGTYQINGSGLFDLETINDTVHFSLFDPENIEKTLYYKKYNSLPELVATEKRINFSSAKWQI